MYDAENNGPNKSGEVSAGGPTGYTGETDRVNGEYHYKSGYTQRIYSDAHYIPANDTTVPPRRYAPSHAAEPKTTQRKPKPKAKAGGRVAAVLALCVAFLAMGTAVGAWYSGTQLKTRIELLENALLEQQAETVMEAAEAIAMDEASPRMFLAESAAVDNDSDDEVSSEPGKMTPADIYDLACRQVVGITTEVTYSNYFGRTSSSAVSGSGFILSSDGYILTNYHVIEYAYQYGYEVTVMTHDGTRYTAEIVGVEDSNDIAVLKISATNLEPVTAADSETLRVGDDIYAVGNPLGELEFSMTCGHVSALDRLISTDSTDSAVNMFQIDAAVNTGNSGGPLYDAEGRVVGVVTAKYSSSGVEGIGFAIPINDVSRIANDLINVGYVTGKASLSLTIDERFNSVYAQYYGLPEGAYIYSVDAGGCAEAAGIQSGDIILNIGDTRITGASQVKTALHNLTVGDTVSVTIYREGESRTVSVQLDEEVPVSAAERR